MRQTNETKPTLAREREDLPPTRAETPSPEDVRAYIARAHDLRGEAMIASLRAITRGATRLFARTRSGGARDETEAFRNALTGLRSSAEILRDEPNVSPARRRRLVEIILREEQRLERLVGALGRDRNGSERA